MSITASIPVLRESAASSAAPQASLTVAERELQIEAGTPPMEVASAEQEALRWRKNEDGHERRKRRRTERRSTETADDNGSFELDESTDEKKLDLRTETVEADEEEKTGNLLDSRL